MRLNMAFATAGHLHQIRESFSEVFGRSRRLGMRNDLRRRSQHGELEKHIVNGKERTLLVHRKGATRAFGLATTKSLRVTATRASR